VRTFAVPDVRELILCHLLVQLSVSSQLLILLSRMFYLTTLLNTLEVTGGFVKDGSADAE
jgi:hypothetical protein